MERMFCSKKCVDARRNVRYAVLFSKDRRVRQSSPWVHEISFFPKEAWKAMKSLRDGHNAHDVDYKPFMFRMANGELTKTDKNAADGLARNFKDTCNRKVAVDWDFVDNIARKYVLNCIGRLMRFPELGTHLYRLSWHKAPGNNGASPNGFKVLEERHEWKSCGFVNDWIVNPELTCEAWLLVVVKPFPKKGDLLDLNDWRDIILIDIASKIVSIFLNLRLQILLKLRGIPCKFGATPKLGFQDAPFVLKTFV